MKHLRPDAPSKVAQPRYDFMSDTAVKHGGENDTAQQQGEANIYFVGPLGPFVWLPPVVILFGFVFFFSASFIQFHAENKDRYTARRNRLLLETHTRAQMTRAYSDDALIEILPKPRMRAFHMKVNIGHVMKEIWQYHGANPRKIQALMVQQMKMHVQFSRRSAAEGREFHDSRLVSASGHAQYFEAPRSVSFETPRTRSPPTDNHHAKSRSILAKGHSIETDIPLRNNPTGRRGRQLPKVPPVACVPSRNAMRPISPSASMRRLPHYSPTSGPHGPSPLALSGSSPRYHPTAPPIEEFHTHPPFHYDEYFNHYNRHYYDESLDRECEDDFVGVRAGPASKHTADKKKPVSVFMMQRIVRKN